MASLALPIASWAATGTGTASATVIQPIAISQTTGLDFGKFSATGTVGTVVMSTAGARSATGGVSLSSMAAGAAAAFVVTGEPNATYTITLPATPATLTSGANTMTADTFTSNPVGTGTLTGAGTQTINVGATLNVGATQAPGTYTGTYSVTVDYN
jgi:hypothetical protein